MKKLSSVIISIVLVLAMTMSVFAYQTTSTVSLKAGNNGAQGFDFKLNENEVFIGQIPVKATETGKVNLTFAAKGDVDESVLISVDKFSFETLEEYAKNGKEKELDYSFESGAKTTDILEIKKDRPSGVYASANLSFNMKKGQTFYIFFMKTSKTTGSMRVSLGGVLTKPEVKVGKVSGLKVKNKKGKKAVVSWKKASNAKKYTVMYATKKSFKGAKKKNVSGTKATIKKLKKKKTYYFKVRGVNGSKTGAWSAVKKVKIKK